MKKALVVLLAVALVFSFAATAMAFTDIGNESAKTQDAINRFAAYGIINGYTDGTFLPDGNITRAEFAAIIIRYTGNEVLSDALKNATSQYSDVVAGEWYAGYVNAATALGYFQGMGDGTFGVAANVTYGQVVTVLLRLAGYTDQLPGSWPFNYVAQGTKLGLVQAATAFDVAGPATRKDVVLMADKNLGTPMVAFDKDIDTFIELGGKVKDKVTALGEADKEFDVALTYDAKDGLKVAGLKLAADCAITDSYSLFDAVGKHAKGYLNAAGDLALIDLEGKYALGAVTAATAGKTITVNGTTYDYTGSDVKKGDYVELTLDDEGAIVSVAKKTEGRDAIIVEKIANNTITGITVKGGFNISTAATAKNLVIKNNALVAVADIAVGDLVYKNADQISGYDVYEVIAPAGEYAVSSITSDDGVAIKTSVVNGVTYAGGIPFTTISDATPAPVAMVVADYTGNTGKKGVLGKFYLDKYSIPVAMVYGKAAEQAKTTTVYGYIMDGALYTVNKAASVGEQAGTKAVGFSSLTVLTSTGETVKYTIKDNGYNAQDASKSLFDSLSDTAVAIKGQSAAVAKFDMVELTLDTDNVVIGIAVAPAATAISSVDDKLNIVEAGGTKYNLPGTTPVFNVTTKSGKISAVKVQKVSDLMADLKANIAKVGIKVDNTTVLYAVLTDAAGAITPATYGVLETPFFEGESFKVYGADAIAYVEKPTSPAYGTGDVVSYELKGGKVDKVTVAKSYADIKAATAKIDSVSGNIVNLDNNTQSVINDKTIVYVYGNSGFTSVGSAADLVKGVKFVAGPETSGVCDFVVVIK